MADEVERPSLGKWIYTAVGIIATVGLGIGLAAGTARPMIYVRPLIQFGVVLVLGLFLGYCHTLCEYRRSQRQKYKRKLAEEEAARLEAAAVCARAEAQREWANAEARRQEEVHEAERAANKVECGSCGVLIRCDWTTEVSNGFRMCRICLKQATEYPPGTEKIGVRRMAYLAEEIECGKCHQPRPRSVFWKTPKVEQQLVPAICKVNPVRLSIVCDSCWATLMTEKLPHTFPWAKRAFPDRQQDVTVRNES